MPELPEVETIRRYLSRKLLGKTIQEIVIEDARLIKGIPVQQFTAAIQGKTVQDVFRRGKVILIKFAPELFLVLHLRISGWLILSGQKEKFSRVIFVFSGSSMLNFCDSRLLGEIRLVKDWQELPIIKKMGPEPFALNRESFIALFKGKKSKIKTLLMDQAFIAGIGNIYAQESLFCAGIHPERHASSLGAQELGKLYLCIKDILKAAVAKKGSSVDTYRTAEGKSGGYEPLLRVYQRQNKPCFDCKTPVIRAVVNGRGTCFCPQCQK